MRLLLALATALLACSCGRADVAYHSNGNKRHEGERSRLSGEKKGQWTYWYYLGALREQGAYEAGQRTGMWTQWHVEGERFSHGERRWNPETGGSERVGPWSFWHSNGRKFREGSYDEEGRRKGTWLIWEREGSDEPSRSEEYVAGVLQ